MKSLNHTFFNDERVRAELDAIERDYEQNFRVFCESLDITPAQLRSVEHMKLITVMVMRVFDITSREIAALKARVAIQAQKVQPLNDGEPN